MNNLSIIFVKDPGVFGITLERYRNDNIKVRYYLDGISYDATLEPDEYNIFMPEGVYDD